MSLHLHMSDELTARQREILDAARALLAREGVERLTVGRLAQALEIKAPSLYKHFAGRGQIEAHLIADGLTLFAQTLEQAGGGLARIAAAYRAFALEHTQLYRLMAGRPDELEACAAGPFRAALKEPDLARAAWAFAHGMVELELAGRAGLDPAWRTAVAAFDRAARARAEQDRPAPGVSWTE